MMRHDDPDVRGYAVTHPPGLVRLPTQPAWDQVVYARDGLIDVRASDAAWLVPAGHALCVPAGIQLRIRTRRTTAVRCLYTRARAGDEPSLLRGPVRVVSLGPLGRELVLHAVEHAPLDSGQPTTAALLTLLGSQLDRATPTVLHLPLPTDPRGRTLGELILAEPSAALAELMAHAPASRRTLERVVRAETGLTLAGWQRRARMLTAIGLLAEGRSVTETAMEVGYATPSSFAAAFRAEVGTTPRAHLRLELDGGADPPVN